MQRRQLFLLTIAALSLVVATITLSVVLGKSKDESESSSSLASTNDDESFLTPDAKLELVTVSPSIRPSFRPSSLPTTEINFNETMEPSNVSATDSPSPSGNTSLWPSISPTSENETFWSSTSPTSENETFWPSFSPTLQTPSISPVLENSNDGRPAISTPQTTQQPVTTSPVASTSTTFRPSPNPTPAPTKLLTPLPTQKPTSKPTMEISAPSASPSLGGVGGRMATLTPGAGTRFYAIGDVPYNNAEAKQLKVQIANLPQDAEFLIHVGDIRSARNGRSCKIEEYYEVAGILNQSHAPVFLVLGDNEWNDCPNINQGFDYWMKVFGRFDEQWDHSFSIIRHDERTENFYFVHKRTLFFGLNIVGGLHRPIEWEERLQDLFEWVKATVDSRVASDQPEADSVVIFGHADPNNNHADFFDSLKVYLGEDSVADIPFLYLNGDAHAWDYKESFYDRSNFLRMQVEGGTREPPLQVSLDNTNARSKPASNVFSYDRMLSDIEI